MGVLTRLRSLPSREGLGWVIQPANTRCKDSPIDRSLGDLF